ncbi:sodium/nucleoside cotransporter 1 [Microcaecilia unicolor]|uniref:Sodium/nucleoside cotransporter n=1 Tax=Microcaecilia unicolor TaxID=1415580 RepID=A0A6P7WSR6_9AMPH|nr:sodium/nucleoside cotransporter 1 [Microcaecilia unicolor]
MEGSTMKDTDIKMEEVKATNDPKYGVENKAYDTEEESAADGALPQKTSHQSETKRNSRLLSAVSQPFTAAAAFCRAHSKVIKIIIAVVLCAAFAAYFIAACVLNFQRAIALLVITCVVVFFLSYDFAKRRWGKKILKFLSPAGKCFRKNWWWLKWVLCVIILVGLVLWLALDTAKRPEQLISFGGVCMFVIFLFACSKHHRAVSWRAVGWGLGLEFVLGILIVRTDAGFQAFQFLGDQIQVFLNYTKVGSGFVFGTALIQNVFAFQALPIVVFFSSVMSILYYFGLMQWIILKISWLMQVTMGTTATETLSVAGNIFVGQTEAPLLIRPYLADMTKSEVHAVMTGGFATIAGSVLGAYISFGIDASSLIAASVMAAPCALALSKLVYPEVEESKFKSDEGVKIEKGDEQNFLEAASNGASISIGLVANIAANLIAFMALLAFVNSAFSWLGGMVNYPQLTLQLIISYIFMPVAFMMGVQWDEAQMVAEMLGTKIILNEFVAYEKLSSYKKLRLSGAEEWINGDKQWISMRAETITTFALCGFANISSIGIMLGGLTAMAPQRKSEFAQIVSYALMTGACVSMVNACVAGILYVPRGQVQCLSFFNSTLFNGTDYNVYVCCTELFANTVRHNGTLGFTGGWEGLAQSAVVLQRCCDVYNSTSC